MTDTFDPDIFDGLQAEEIPDTEFAAPNIPDDAASLADEPYDSPDTGIITQRQRPQKAKTYERKVKSVLSAAFKVTASHPATVPDAAAILMYGPNLAEKAGDLAADEAWAARAIDFLTEGAENSKLAFASAAGIFALQILRNHEPSLQPNPDRKGFKIPFARGRRMKLKFGIKLGRVRELTHEPTALSDYVFSNPAVMAALKKQGINVQPPKNRRG